MFPSILVQTLNLQTFLLASLRSHEAALEEMQVYTISVFSLEAPITERAISKYRPMLSCRWAFFHSTNKEF